MPSSPLPVVLAVLLAAFATASALTGVRGWRGELRRGGRVGVRTPAATASDAAFAAANRVAAPPWIGAAVIGLVAAGLEVALRPGVVLAIVIFVLGMAGLLGLTAAGAVLGERAARSVPVPARAPAAAGAGCGGCACGGGGCAGLTRTQAPAAG